MVAIVEPPSVAAAMDGTKLELEAVWNVLTDIMESVGVGPFAPTARGRSVRSSEPFGFGAGRMVRIEDKDGGCDDSRG